jgi:AcrR family transcriptional regulator
MPAARDHAASVTEGAPARRQYDNSLRRERAQETRERIITAGAELLHGSPIRDWRTLTIRAVAEHARVNERTVYRHFANERGLHDAVMRRLEQQAGIDLAGLRLEDVPGVAARIFEHVSTYPLEPRSELDPTLIDANQRQRLALLAAVAGRSDGWSDADRTLAAAMLDVVWALASYERIVADWRLAPGEAIRGVTWVTGLIERAVMEAVTPPAAS